MPRDIATTEASTEETQLIDLAIGMDLLTSVVEKLNLTPESRASFDRLTTKSFDLAEARQTTALAHEAARARYAEVREALALRTEIQYAKYRDMHANQRALEGR